MKNKIKKIDLDKEERMRKINNLALIIQDTKLKSLTEIRKIAETIEYLSDDSLLKGMNASIDDFNNGRFTVLTKEDLK